MEESKVQSTGGTPQPNKKGNGKLIGGIIAVVALLMIGTIVFALSKKSETTFKKLTGSPEEVVMAAISNTSNKSLEEQAQINAKLGKEQIKKITEKAASEVNFNIGLQGISGVENANILSAYIKDTGLSGTFQSTKEQDKMNGSLNITQSGIEFIKASFYKDNDEVGVSIPKILDAPYAIKLDSFMEDYKKSAFYQMIGGKEMNEEEFEQISEVFSAFGEYMAGTMNLSTNKEFITQTEAVQAEFIKNAELKENGTKQVILQDGSEVEWKIYSGTLTGQELVDFINKEMELIMNLDFAKNYFDVVAKQSGYTVEEMLEQVQTELKADDTRSIAIDFFVDEEYLRGINLDIKEQEEEICNINVQYTGNNCLLDGMIFNLNINDDDESLGIKFTFNQNLGEEADVFNQNFELSLSEDSNTMGTIQYGYSYDTKAKEDNLNVTFGIDFGSELTANFVATGTKTVSNEEVSTNLSTASVDYDFEGETVTLDFNLGYGVKEIKASDIIIDKTGVKYLLEMSEEELTNALQTIQSNIQAFTYGLL